jgi:Spy/CpxP family protein refolding chaperone
MTDNNEGTGREEQAVRRRSRHGFWLGLAAGGLLGVAVSGAVALGAGALAAGHLGGGHGRHGFFRHQDPELAREHMELATDWILSRVDATEDQKGQAKRVVSETFDDLLPLVQEHRSIHETLVEEMTRANLDPEAIERLRRGQVELFDQASKEITGSLTELAGILTPEQRAELVEMGRRFRH